MVSFHMHHVVFKLNMCFPPPPPPPFSVDPIIPSNPDDNSPRLQQSQWQWWEGAESKRSPPPLPHPVWSEMEWCCCSSHTFTQQVQWVWVWGWWGGGASCWASSLSLEQQREAARLFTLHPSRSCDFHMVSPPSLISAKSAGGKNGAKERANKEQRS